MNIKPLPPFTRLLILLLKINIGVLVAAIIADIYTWYDYSKLAPEEDMGEIILASDLLSLLMAIIQAPFTIFLGVIFLRWIYRANANLHILSSESMEFSPGWSVGWYFIPIANLFKPYQAMKEIWKIAHRGRPSNSSILGWWWFLWILSILIGRIALKLTLKAENAQSYTSSAIGDGAANGIDIILTYIAIMLIMAVSKAYCSNYVEQSILPAIGLAGTTQPADSEK
jgi:hypothetical protein